MFPASLQRRALSTTSNPRLRHSIFVSKSTNPYFNLSFEDWLFRHKPYNDPLLLFYQNEPCVIIGRNQNPWKEVNFPALRVKGIPFIRRRSGGGTVYHDLGNVNFSIHLPRTKFSRQATGALIERAVRDLNIDARTNERNDLCVNGRKICFHLFHLSKHASGSAYKIVKDRAYHHGTMLISTKLDTLGGLLYTIKDSMVSKGVGSVRSAVCNLEEFRPGVTSDDFTSALIKIFRESYGIEDSVQMVHETDMVEESYLQKGMGELKTWEWALGQTPHFSYTVSREFVWGDVRAEIGVEHGIIQSCKISNQGRLFKGMDLAALGSRLEGRKYGLADAADDQVPEGPSSEVWSWIHEIMRS